MISICLDMGAPALLQSQLDAQHGNALLDFMTSCPTVCPFVCPLTRSASIYLSIYQNGIQLWPWVWVLANPPIVQLGKEIHVLDVRRLPWRIRNIK